MLALQLFLCLFLFCLLERTTALSCANGCTLQELLEAGCIYYEQASRGHLRCTGEDGKNGKITLEGVLYITGTERLQELEITSTGITSIDPRTYKLANATLQTVNLKNNKLTDPTPLVGMGEWCTKVYSLVMDGNPWTTIPTRAALNLPLFPNATQVRDPHNLFDKGEKYWPSFGFCFSDGCLWQEINLVGAGNGAEKENPTQEVHLSQDVVGVLNVLNLPSTVTKLISKFNFGTGKPLSFKSVAPAMFGATQGERSRWTDISIDSALESMEVGLFAGLTNLKTLSLTQTELTALPGMLLDTNTKLQSITVRGNSKLTTIHPSLFEKNVALTRKRPNKTCVYLYFDSYFRTDIHLYFFLFRVVYAIQRN